MTKEKIPANNNIEASDGKFYKQFGDNVIRSLNENLIIIKDYRDKEEAKKLLEKMKEMIEKGLDRIEK